MAILNISNNRLYKNVELTPIEANILKYLSNNELIDYDTLIEKAGVNSFVSLKKDISYLRKKTGLTIKSKQGGYILIDDIWID